MKVMKVREVITSKGWANGSGWSYEQIYSDNIIEIDSESIDHNSEVDWEFWETEGEPRDGGDVEITVAYYAENGEPDEDEPLATWSKWENELIEERSVKPKTSPAKLRANEKYNKSRERLSLRFPAGTLASLEAKAQRAGLSRTKYIIHLIENDNR